MSKPKLKYRMYFFVPYNISDIQKGIQAGHAALEYAVKYHNDDSFRNFVFWDKTWIILNGGTSNDGRWGSAKGTMEDLYNEIRDQHISCVTFNEPDINHATTAICFIADERVWDYENYPDFIDHLLNVIYPRDGLHGIESKSETFVKLRLRYDEEMLKDKYPLYYKEWSEHMGGEQNIFLRNLLKDKILA